MSSLIYYSEFGFNRSTTRSFLKVFGGDLDVSRFFKELLTLCALVTPVRESAHFQMQPIWFYSDILKTSFFVLKT